MKNKLIGACGMIALAVTICRADPPMGRFYGVKLTLSSGTFIGYVDKLVVKELYDQLYNPPDPDIVPPEPVKEYSDRKIVELLRKQKRIQFWSGLTVIEIPAMRKEHVEGRDDKYTLTVSSQFAGEALSSSTIKGIERHPGPEDGKSIWGILGVSPRELELYQTKKPFFVCSNDHSEMNQYIWISYNDKIDAEELGPLCTRGYPNWPTKEEQASMLKNKDVFRLVYPVD